MHKMSRSFSVSSPPTSETNGKNSSGTSTCNGGVHVCPFQLAPPINQFTYCVLKRVCQQILKEILSEEQEQIKNGVNKIQNRDKSNIRNISLSAQQHNSSSIESPLTKKCHHKVQSKKFLKMVPKSNKATQTQNGFQNVDENCQTNVKKTNFMILKQNMKTEPMKKNIRIIPELHKSGLPMILNLRSKVRNGEINDSK